MAERTFNPNTFNPNTFKPGGIPPPVAQPTMITLESMLQYHAYFKSVPEPSEVMKQIIDQMETRLLTIITSFNSGTNR